MKPEAWDNYTKMLRRSSDAVWVVARYLHNKGVKVTIPPVHVAPTVKQYNSYIDEGDIIIHRDGTQQVIEVKHQSWEWTSHKDIPWKNIIVCAKKSFDRHTNKPAAYFLVNKQMTHSLVISTHTSSQWHVRVVHDKVKDWHQTMYMTQPIKHEFIAL